MTGMEDLALPLPEEIQKAKDAGYFAEAGRMIRKKREDPLTPEWMKRRLALEQEVLRRLPGNYPYSEQQALSLVQKEIPDFTMEELRECERSGQADFLYVEGKMRLQESFFGSMKIDDPEIRKRAGGTEEDRSVQWARDLLREMREAGRAVRHIRLKEELRLRDDLFQPSTYLVHLPVPLECGNMRSVKILGTSHAPLSPYDPHAGAGTVAFRERMSENASFWVEYAYDSVVACNRIDASAAQPCDIRECLQEEAPQIVFTPLVKKVCAELKGEEENPLKIARRIYDFITTKVRYSFVREYFTLGQIPEYCLTRRRGDCGVQAITFITLCRCAGIPAQWQSGLFVTQKSASPHDWARFYVRPYGWLWADCSFGGSMYRNGFEDGWNYYFGNLDPCRMASANRFQAPLRPQKKQYRSDPYDNQVGEMESLERGFRAGEFTAKREVVSFQGEER